MASDSYNQSANNKNDRDASAEGRGRAPLADITASATSNTGTNATNSTNNTLEQIYARMTELEAMVNQERANNALLMAQVNGNAPATSAAEEAEPDANKKQGEKSQTGKAHPKKQGADDPDEVSGPGANKKRGNKPKAKALPNTRQAADDMNKDATDAGKTRPKTPEQGPDVTDEDAPNAGNIGQTRHKAPKRDDTRPDQRRHGSDHPKDRRGERARIPRPPRGTNLRKAMGFDPLLYHGTQRLVQDGVVATGMNWEDGWNAIPARDKHKLYSAVREEVPEMGRFVNDWATEEMAKQFMKNRRSHAYRKGYLEVPSKYTYLKNNAAKRSDAPRGNGRKRPADENTVAGPSRVRSSRTQDLPIGPPAKKAKKAKKAKVTVKGKGKQRAEPSDDEEEEEEGSQDDSEEESDA